MDEGAAAAEGGGGDPNKISYIVHPQVDREFHFFLLHTILSSLSKD